MLTINIGNHHFYCLLYVTKTKLFQFTSDWPIFYHNIFIPADGNNILFGIHKEQPDSVNNFIILCAKHYIWNNKFRDPHTPFSIKPFCNILKARTNKRKNAAEMVKDYEQIAN